MNDSAPSQLLAPAPERVSLELARIEQSPAFKASARHRAFLRYLVQTALKGDAVALKESVIAVEVFGRPAARFDPKTDTIVRVEARRLRARLADYYRAAGHSATVHIALPVGSYVPVFREREPTVQSQATRRARDLYERGEYFLRQPLSLRTLRSAVERFDAALALSPDMTVARVGLGRAWLNLATGWYEAPAKAARTASDALDRALDLEPGQPVALALRAAIASQFDRDWPAARQLFQQAMQAAPHEAFVHAAFGAHLQKHGELDAAEAELRLARQLDPLYVNARVHMVNLRIAQRRLNDADAELEAMRDLAGASISTLALSAALALYRNDTAQAVAGYRAACTALPDVPACAIALATALAAHGQIDEADAVYAQALQQLPGDLRSPYLLALFERWRGRPDAAFDQLERALLLRDPYAPQIPDEPSFDGLHVDPRWDSVARRSRLP